ncbi:hypothetical protein R1flu_019367 [Riccia fluitans]|uniref:Serine protease n=1 Tax=Riccia fluitans TaxID=41844 RepID=A0ABD1ZIF9_9MARC
MSCFSCCTGTGHQPKRDNQFSEAVKPTLVAINILDNDRGYKQGTGILISDHLVLTSHVGLPSMGSAHGGQVILTTKGSSNSLPSSWQSSSTILTRKLLPQRLFVTSPALGFTIVACEAVNSSSSPKKYEIPKAREDGLKLSCSVYVLGQVQHDDRQGLLMFGQGLVSKEDEHVIEFYSLDGYVWAAGSAGFDAKGTFAFVVGDRHPLQKVSSPFPKRWSYTLSKGPSSTQRGILIHAVRDWTRDTWSGDFNTLFRLCNSAPAASVDPTPALKISAQKMKALERQKTLRKRVNEIQIEGDDEQAAATIPRIRTIRSNLQDYGKSFYGATDAISTTVSPKIKDIPVQASFLHYLPCENVDAVGGMSQLYLKSQSPPNLGGIAALAAEELERHGEKGNGSVQGEVIGSQRSKSPLQARNEGKAEVDFSYERKFSTTTESRGDELNSQQSCWFSSWWNNFRPKSPRQQRGHKLVAGTPDSTAAAECEIIDSTKTEEDTTKCFEPDSPPRRFLVRGAFTAAPRRDISSQQTEVNNEPTIPTSPRNSSSPCFTLDPLESRVQAASRTFSPEIPCLHLRQSELTDSRRIQPTDPPQLLHDVARIPRPGEDEQKELKEATGPKVTVGMGICLKVEDRTSQQSYATSSQNHIVSSPIAAETSTSRELNGKNFLQTESCTCSLGSTTRQSTRCHEVSEEKNVTLLDSSLVTSTTTRPISRKTRHRMIECTCFRSWHKFVTRKKDVAVESMWSLFSPRTISISTASSRSVSSSPRQPTWSSHQMVDSKPLSDDGTVQGDPASCFVGSPLSIHNEESGGQEVQAAKTSASDITPIYENESSDEQMLKWAMTQNTTSDETLDLLNEKQLAAYEGGRDTAMRTLEEPAAAQVVKIWNKSCIANFTPQQDDNREVEDESSPMTSRSETTSRSSPRVEKNMKRNDQRKETRNQRPRWSIARVDKGPLNMGPLLDHPLDDLPTKNKQQVRNQPQSNAADMKVVVSQEEGAMMKKCFGLKTLADQNNVRKRERQGGQTRSSSPRRKPALDTNCKGKSSSLKPFSERSTSPCTQAARLSSKRWLETPPVRKGSSVSSSSSDREGRPRWRCS